MNNNGPPLAVKVWGDFACFTRPEMKVERVSYPVMTPSAARGILEAIFWKPECRWRVREIHVLKEIRYFSILRNEVSSRASVERARKGFFADDPNERTQRHTLCLRDVAYLIRADVEPHGNGSDEEPAKFRDQFRRRVQAGRCFSIPYFGCREFSASFGPPDPNERPLAMDGDLGRMLFDIAYEDNESGRGKPIFFNARVRDGVLAVPPELYDGR